MAGWDKTADVLFADMLNSPCPECFYELRLILADYLDDSDGKYFRSTAAKHRDNLNGRRKCKHHGGKK